jgi:glycosyltransferase involved in cell wall biosynthesis
MKIAYFTDTYLPQINGVTNTLSKLTDYLDKNNDIEYKIFAPDFGKNFTYDNRIESFFSMKFMLYPECRLSFPNFLRLNIALADFKPDIVHAVTEINMGLSGIRYARSNKLPLVTTFTTNLPEYTKYYNLPFLYDVSWSVMKKIHNQADLCVCPSIETKLLLESKGIENVGIWGRGIDFNKFKPIENKNWIKKKYNIENKIMLLYVGRISNEKNIDVLISAYEKLCKKYGDKIALVITGGGPLLEELKEKYPYIIYTGYLREKDLTDVYSAADIFAFPSTTETLGNVVLESMASGVPVVGPSAGGLKENIIHMYNGILSKPNDIDSFYSGIDLLIRNDSLRKTLSHNARQFAETKSWNSVFESLIEKYHMLINKKLEKKIA